MYLKHRRMDNFIPHRYLSPSNRFPSDEHKIYGSHRRLLGKDEEPEATYDGWKLQK